MATPEPAIAPEADTLTAGTCCYHCSNPVEDTPVLNDGHAFCCAGCSTVYSLLRENGLCAYYDMEGSPGAQMSAPRQDGRFAFLDLEDVRSRIISFTDGTKAQVSLFIPAIHCSSCIYLLEHLDRLHPGIASSKVDFLKKEVTVQFRQQEITLRGLAELLDSIGYAPSLTLNDLSGKDDRSHQRGILVRLAVAGFAFGNIMLLSLPDYLSTGISEVEHAYQRYFNLINLLLGTLVFAYPSVMFMRSAWNALRHRTVNIDVPLSLGILALYGRSVFEIVAGSGVGYMDSLAGLIFFLLIGRWYQDKTYRALSFDRDYTSYFPIAVTRIRDGQEECVALKDVGKGDELLILSNGLLPADAVLLSERADIDYSFVTGESDPVPRQQGDALYAGGRQTGGAIRVALTKDVSQSYLTRLWDSDAFKKEGRTLASLMDSVARRFTIVVMVIALGAAIAWLFIDPSRSVDVFTAVLIIACPCALALTMPFALGNGIRILGRNGLFLKDAAAIERLADVTAVVLDKTGTLTTSERPEVHWQGSLSPGESEAVAAVAANSSHPLSRAIAQHLTASKGIAVADFAEETGRGIRALADGAEVRLGTAEWAGHIADVKQGAASEVHVSIGGRYCGKFTIRKRYRSGLSAMFKQLWGTYRTLLLSGDNDSERIRLAEEFGLQEMHFRQSPFDKLERVKELQDAGERVLMAGDGLNDAGALRQADAGLSVTEDVHGFSPACDGILEGSRLHLLPDLLSFAKSCIKVVRWSFLISLTYNTVGILLAVQGLVSPLVAAILMPLSSVTVVAFSTLGTGWMARREGFSGS